MKTKPTLISCFAAVALFAGCKFFGVDPVPPTAIEQHLFTTLTNYVDVVREREVTNFVTLQVPVFVTNSIGQVVFTTNAIVERQIEHVLETNQVPVYTLTPSPAATAGVGVLSTIANMVSPGSGQLIGYGILAALGAWGHLRSSKRGKTNDALTQEVETIREFIKTLPAGAKYDQAITSFLQQHQLEAGVATQVLGLLAKKVNNTEAKAAIQQIQETLKVAQAPG